MPFEKIFAQFLSNNVILSVIHLSLTSNTRA